MKPLRHALAWLTACIVAGALVHGPAEAAGPWRGQVVDAETGQPLEGVVVLAVWEKVSPGAMHPAREFEDVDEVVTDSEGRFVVPARRLTTLNPFVSIEGPQLTMFKAGYGQHGFRGEYEWLKKYSILERQALRSVARKQFEESEAQFELPPLSRDARYEFISHASRLFLIPMNRIPRYMSALNRERVLFHLAPIEPR